MLVWDHHKSMFISFIRIFNVHYQHSYKSCGVRVKLWVEQAQQVREARLSCGENGVRFLWVSLGCEKELVWQVIRIYSVIWEDLVPIDVRSYECWR